MASAAERDVGQFPLSIGTSLALEGSLGIHPDRPVGNRTLYDYQTLWVNVKTAFRNYYRAIDKDSVTLISKEELIEQFHLELHQIVNVVDSQTNGAMKVVFFVSDYHGLEKKYTHAVMRVDSTENQKLFTKTMKTVISNILASEPDLIQTFQRKIEKQGLGKGLMLTSYAYDLTSAKAFSNLALLESNTGAIKERNLWYTKYYNGKELSMIPFREDFLPIFGDSELFRPIGMAYRKNLIDIGKKYNWNFSTTREKIIYGIDSLKDKFLAATLKRFITGS